MKSFSLELHDATRSQQVAGVTSFVGEDASGSFGVLAGHARMTTSLVVGLARFRVGQEGWTYVAAPGGILYFRENVLTLSTRRYLLDDDYTRISQLLQQQLLTEEHALATVKAGLHRMDEDVLKRLWEMGRA